MKKALAERAFLILWGPDGRVVPFTPSSSSFLFYLAALRI